MDEEGERRLRKLARVVRDSLFFVVLGTLQTLLVPVAFVTSIFVRVIPRMANLSSNHNIIFLRKVSIKKESSVYFGKNHCEIILYNVSKNLLFISTECNMSISNHIIRTNLEYESYFIIITYSEQNILESYNIYSKARDVVQNTPQYLYLLFAYFYYPTHRCKYR